MYWQVESGTFGVCVNVYFVEKRKNNQKYKMSIKLFTSVVILFNVVLIGCDIIDLFGNFNFWWNDFCENKNKSLE